MADAVKIVGGTGILLARELNAAGCLPEPKLNFDAAIGLASDAPDNQVICIDGTPIGELRHLINAGVFPAEYRLINRLAPLCVRSESMIREISRAGSASERLAATKSGNAIRTG
jgi:hypothetical protein